jgi:hypothetical protein
MQKNKSSTLKNFSFVKSRFRCFVKSRFLCFLDLANAENGFKKKVNVSFGEEGSVGDLRQSAQDESARGCHQVELPTVAPLPHFEKSMKSPRESPCRRQEEIEIWTFSRGRCRHHQTDP